MSHLIIITCVLSLPPLLQPIDIIPKRKEVIANVGSQFEIVEEIQRGTQFESEGNSKLKARSKDSPASNCLKL